MLGTLWPPGIFVAVAVLNLVCLIISCALLPETDGIDLSAIKDDADEDG